MFNLANRPTAGCQMTEIDRSIISRCLNNDKKAHEEFYKILYRMLIGVCWRYAGNKEKAVEYMNLGFVRILMNLKQYKDHIPFDLWARRVVINTIINEFNREKKWQEKTRSIENKEQVIAADKDLTDFQEDMIELIKEKIPLLPPMTARVFNLYAIDGYVHQEIAKMLGITEGTSAWHYSEAKKRIRQMIGVNQET